MDNRDRTQPQAVLALVIEVLTAASITSTDASPSSTKTWFDLLVKDKVGLLGLASDPANHDNTL